MNDITAPPTVASSTHLPASHTALIGAPRVAEETGAARIYTRSGSTWTDGVVLTGDAGAAATPEPTPPAAFRPAA